MQQRPIVGMRNEFKRPVPSRWKGNIGPLILIALLIQWVIIMGHWLWLVEVALWRLVQ